MISHSNRKKLIERNNIEINISRQAELLEISRSSIYYQPVVNEYELQLLNYVDEIYTDYPFYGSRRIKDELGDRYKIYICRDYVRKLMQILGLQAIYPRSKKNISKPNPENKTYPYLLRELTIKYPNHVWGTDITYLRLHNGFVYLTVIMDWYSRYVISWKLSNSLHNTFCIDCLSDALEIGLPKYHNSDQGSQYTSKDYINILEESKIQISMDGRGRCMDNIFTERLWRTVKYENVYIKSYLDFLEAEEGLRDYFDFYNNKRRHQSLPNRQTPASIYFK